MITKNDVPVLKARPEDFVVWESQAPRLRHDPPGAHQYLQLRKRGYTTFAAVALIAEFAGIDRSAVRYSGLKDEDAVTTQFISIPAEPVYPVQEFNHAYAHGDASLHLIDCGFGDEPAEIGRLCGNSFRIVIRNLSAEVGQALQVRRHNHVFLNYYDTQRFGVPGGPRTTHLIGAHLLQGDEDNAFDLLKRAQSTESIDAQSWKGTSEEFFSVLDPRTYSFYLSSHASHEWNQQLGQLAENPMDFHTSVRDGINYRFARTRQAVARIALSVPELPYTKYRADDLGEVRAVESSRSTVVQTQVEAGHLLPDAIYPGSFSCEVVMFLPSGCYATSAIAQLLPTLTDNTATKLSASRLEHIPHPT